MKLICIGCGKQPSEIAEYTDREVIGDMTPDDYVRAEEGTRMESAMPRTIAHLVPHVQAPGAACQKTFVKKCLSNSTNSITSPIAAPHAA